MDCRDVLHLLHPYSDGELDLVRHLQVEHHLAECTECDQHVRELRSLSETLASVPLYHRAPDTLLAKVQTALKRTEFPRIPRKQRRFKTPLLATAAGLFLVAVAALAGGVFRSKEVKASDRVLDQVIAGHVRSLQACHLTDVPSSDSHTVKPWFTGKLDFSPQVPDLASHGYTLSGGRLDYLADRPVAALIYLCRKHVINLFAWPVTDTDESTVRSFCRQGFHVFHWQDSGVQYWAISDLNAKELDEFVQLFRQFTTATP
jgi:anti-sigma factor RsiW